MIYSGRKTVAAVATPEPLTATHIMASWVTVVGLRSNTGLVYVGGVDETNHACAVLPGAATHVGHPLTHPADEHDGSDFCNLREVGGTPYIDLHMVYVAVDVAGEGVSFNYGRR